MKYLVVSVFDQGVGCFMTPGFVRSRGEAVRGFMDACRNPDMPFGRHPKDYTLCKLALWDEETGEFSDVKMESLKTALEVMAREEYLESNSK